jgi:hypothetical protein
MEKYIELYCRIKEVVEKRERDKGVLERDDRIVGEIIGNEKK